MLGKVNREAEVMQAYAMEVEYHVDGPVEVHGRFYHWSAYISCGDGRTVEGHGWGRYGAIMEAARKLDQSEEYRLDREAGR